MLPWWAWTIAACWRSRAALVAENLCLRQQLLVTATTAVAASPQRQRSTFLDFGEPMVPGLARHPRRRQCGHGACDFFCVQTITFRTLYVFFVIHHASRQVLHVHVTQHPTAEWSDRQMLLWDCEPPRFLVHDRDSCYGTIFDRRVRNLGITQARTPFRSPRVNAIAERWVRLVRTQCLDHVFIFNEWHLHRLFQPLAPASFDRTTCRTRASHRSDQAGKIIAIPVLGGLHHIYQQAA
jgi:putative transposase